MKAQKVRQLYWDIETAGIVATTWNLYPESIPHDNLLQDWFIISISWKFQGETKIHSVSVLDDPKRFKKDRTDDYHVVKTMRDVFDNVDILVHHNGNAFDVKMFNSRLMHHRLPPLPKMAMVDTLRETKKVAKHTSNRLDFLGQKFLGIGKQQTPPGTWKKAMHGDPAAIKTMVTYNKRDVTILEGYYDVLAPYMKTHPHRGAMMGKHKDFSCPKCGGTAFDPSRDKRRYSAAGVPKLQKQCSTCFSFSTFTLPKNGK